MNEILTVIRSAEIILCAGLAWAFVVRYSRLDWGATREGAHLMRFTLLVALMLTFTAVFQIFAAYLTYRLVLGVVLFAWVAYELVMRLYLLESAQDEAARREREFDDAAAAAVEADGANRTSE